MARFRHSPRPGAPRRVRGIVLITALMLITGMAALISVSLTRSMTEVRAANAFAASQQAFHQAEGGLDVGLHWLATRGAPPSCAANDPTCSVLDQTLALPTGTQQITIKPSTQNATSYVDNFTVSTTSSSSGTTITKQLNLMVHVESFARYAYFSNHEKSAGGQTIWFASGGVIEGPLHSNDQLHIAGTPTFKGPVSSVATTLDYLNGGPPNDKPDFQDTLKLGADAIQLPNPDLTELKAASSLVLKGDTTVKFNGNWIQVTNNNVTSVVQVKDCPALFVDGGNLTVAGGTLDGQMTVATNQSISITDSVIYKCDPTQGKADPDCINSDGVVAYDDDVLGMVAKQDVTVSKKAPNDVTIHATMMAIQGSFGVENYNVNKKGTLTILGGILQDTRGAVGTFSGSTTVSGYQKSYHYDTRLLNMSPPYYPTIGKYQTVLWQDSSNH